MNPSPYGALARHYEACFARHGDTHKGVDWPNAEDARTRYRVMTQVVRDKGPLDIVDLGCGLGHFLDFLRDNGRTDLRYSGLDISPVFIEACRRKYPGVRFDCADVLENETAMPPADYVVMNGVFTERCGIGYDAMFAFMTAVLTVAFRSARKGIAFNMMSKHVDWERDDLFHVPYDDIARFVIGNLSRHHMVRADYGLYEYTVYVYKTPEQA